MVMVERRRPTKHAICRSDELLRETQPRSTFVFWPLQPQTRCLQPCLARRRTLHTSTMVD